MPCATRGPAHKLCRSLHMAGQAAGNGPVSVPKMSPGNAEPPEPPQKARLKKGAEGGIGIFCKAPSERVQQLGAPRLHP